MSALELILAVQSILPKVEHRMAVASKHYFPATFIRSGKVTLIRERKRGMAYVYESRSRGNTVFRKVNFAKRIPGRFNHGTRPVAKWWHTGLEKNPAAWESMCYRRGVTAHKVRIPPKHEICRTSMKIAWDQYVENFSEIGFTDYVPRVGEFHIHGVRHFVMSRTALSQRTPKSRHFRWNGPEFRSIRR